MAAKNKITQNDLRKFMSIHKQKKLSETNKKIESPLAKYLDDGTIKCILCESIIRSEAVWTVHINSKVHKENIVKRKQAAAFGSVQDCSTHVPPAGSLVNYDDDENNVFTVPPVKRSIESQGRCSPPPKKLKSILKNGSYKPEQNYVESISKPLVDDSKNIDKRSMEVEEIPALESLPENNEETHIDSDPGPSSSDLPEGFFDNPLLDAKARKVEYKDPIEEEWERFQKEMKEEVSLSTRLIEDETEEATVERQIVEVDEQLKNWSRVVDLEKRKENLESQLSMALDVKKEELSDSSSDEGLDEFVHWRNKQSFS